MDSYDPFDNSYVVWPQLDELDCPCKGHGWALIDGNYQECYVHYHGQLHPQSRELLLDEPDRLHEEERKSNLQWQINKVRENITSLQQSLRLEQNLLVQLELELINRTPTVKMRAVSVPHIPENSEAEITNEDMIESSDISGE